MVFHNFYESLKNLDDHFRFVFVTGTTRLALTCTGSGVNNLDDFSFNREDSGICGFTKDELDLNFDDRMEWEP
jgi:hypothetical protein